MSADDDKTEGAGGAEQRARRASSASSSRTTTASCRASSSALAGLIATSIWQYRQSQTAAEQARSEQAIARTKADNDWRIARAEILSKNLNVLSTQGPQTRRPALRRAAVADARGDPRSRAGGVVRAGAGQGQRRATCARCWRRPAQKNYSQLAQAFKLTCLQRFGVEKAAEICKDDALAERSDAIAQVFQDELEAATAASQPPGARAAVDPAGRARGAGVPGQDGLAVRAVPAGSLRAAAVAGDRALREVLDRARGWWRRWCWRPRAPASWSAPARARSWTSSTPTAASGWSATCSGRSCDPDCRGKLVDVMLSSYGEAEGDYDEPLQAPAAPAARRGGADVRPPARAPALVPGRRRRSGVVPRPRAGAALTEALAAPKPDPHAARGSGRAWSRWCPSRPATADAEGAGRLEEDAWRRCAQGAASSAQNARWPRARAASARERANPPPMIKKVNFCNAAGGRVPDGRASSRSDDARAGGRTLLDMNGYQWTVLFAAWLGWGFDVFDGLLFNYVAPNCVPTLLGLPIGSPAAKAATLQVERHPDLDPAARLGGGRHPVRPDRRPHRAHAHAAADDAALRARHGGLRRRAQHLDADRLPHRRQPGHRRRVGGRRGDGRRGRAREAARRGGRAALHVGADRACSWRRSSTSRSRACCFKGSPETSWRYVFLCGLIPAAVALRRAPVRARARALEAGGARPRRTRASPSCSRPSTGALTLSGFAMAVIALITWWSFNAFIPIVVDRPGAGDRQGRRASTGPRRWRWSRAGRRSRPTCFNLGGLIGTLLTIPAAKLLGRRTMFGIYYALSAVAVLRDLRPRPAARDAPLHVLLHRPDRVRRVRQLHLLPARAVPDAPARHRRRLLLQRRPRRRRRRARSWSARSRRAAPTRSRSAMHLLFLVGFVPLVGVLLLPLAVETKGRARWPDAALERRQPFDDHVLQQVDAAVAVAPLVVVPADQLEEVRVQLDRAAGVVDARALVVDEVASRRPRPRCSRGCPSGSVSLAAFIAALISLRLVAFAVLNVRSTTDTVGVGTRNAMPVSLPFTSGSTSATALAAPVVDGMMLMAAAAPAFPVLARRTVDGLLRRRVAVHGGHQALGRGRSLPSGATCTTGARQLVVQLALETMLCLPASYFSWLTPMTTVMSSPLAGRRDDHLLRAGGEVALGLLAPR